MKRPYKLGLLVLGALSIFYTIQCILDFPNWITPSATALAGTIYILYLASKDGGIISYELGGDILAFLFWLTLILTYPIIVYSAWEDREIIRAKIREEIAKIREETKNA